MERQKKQSSIGSHSRKSADPGSSSYAMNPDAQFSLLKFPSEFERHFFDYIDKRFIGILLCSFVVHLFGMLYYLNNAPVEEFTKDDIARIQRKFASLVLDKDVVQFEEAETDQQLDESDAITKADSKAKNAEKNEAEAEEAEDQGKDEKESIAETKTSTAEERKAGRSDAIAARKRSRDAISQEVSTKGVLGLLTASSGEGSGEGVVDILGDIGPSTDNIGNVLSNLDGLKRSDGSVTGSGKGSGARGGKARGERSKSGGSIDELIGNLAEANSKDMSRKGDLMVADAPAIVESASGSHGGGRNPDDVSEIVNKHNAAIQTCYQRELKRNPNLKGKVVVRFTIIPSGKVQDVKLVSSTINNDRVERCIINRIRRWDDFGAIDAKKGNSTFRQVYTFGY
ncbi:TonB family protein [candidate division KSB1 bacterium]|nr:TonB family protein [candidate division KSB1 bacterium]